MVSQRPARRSERRKTVSPVHFNLKKFEADLRRALSYTCDRDCGQPGSSQPDFDSIKNPGTAAKVWLFSVLLSKFDPGTGGKARRDAALEKFWKAEERCFWTNLKFCQSDKDIEALHPGLHRAKRKIYNLLGPEIPLEEISRGFGHGPGATTRLPRSSGDAVYKYSTEVEVTPNALAIGNAAICSQPIWKRMFSPREDGTLDLQTVWGNKVTTVPKNYKTDRVIAVEPDLNMYVQKGLGSVIRRRLKKVGVDLDDQTLNQDAARDLQLATIDFSMASDLVSQGLVRYLLPPNWCDLIASMRSEWGVLDGTLHLYSKVSSMGNGFTFELESLIFWALAAACVSEGEHSRIRVYGDDVILPVLDALDFLELSDVAGFIPNHDKSFFSGPFRESCGKHYFSGCDITPFYIKRPVDTLEELFLLHNNLWRWLQRVDSLLAPAEYAAVTKCLQSLRNLAPARWRRPRIPDGFGDDAFIGSFAQCRPNTCRNGWEAFECSVRALRPPKSGFIAVPDGGVWVKADNILRQRRWILPTVYTLEVTADVARKGKRKNAILRVPWWAWG
jgi:hypothetical protein